jgi:dipeptidyl-peptidase-4
MTRTSDSFPRQYARTQRLTLGEPRTFTVSPDGLRIIFVRTASGDDPMNQLWLYDVREKKEQLLLDPRVLGADLSSMTEEEKRRRERVREGASGIVTYSTDAHVNTVATIVGGALAIVDIESKSVSLPDIAPGVFDARLSPDGTHIAYTRGSALCVYSRGGSEITLASDDNPNIYWGTAEFIAAEEMGRQRGFWWSPDSTSIAATRVDVSPIPTWHIADPAQPQTPTQTHRYPAAGTHNAHVSLHVIDVATHTRIESVFPGEWEYLTSVSWTTAGLIGQTQTRDQREVTIYAINPATGVCTELLNDLDHAWVELVPGVPTLSSSGDLVTCQERDGVRRLYVGGRLVTPVSLQVRSIISVNDDIVFVANDVDTPWVHHVMRYSTKDDALEHITPESFHGVASAVSTGTTSVLRTSTLHQSRATFSIHTPLSSNQQITSFAEEPLVTPNVTIHTVGRRQIPVAIVMPHDHDPNDTHASLPVLFDPYGGPHAQRVLSSQSAYLSSQWFADQGFCVVIADNRGTPGKGTVYERAVLHDLAGPVLEDQIEVLEALPSLQPSADTSRVAIRGWSFGGYLAALAVLRAPDKFHTAVAGAPVTDWRLYDTHYTERYLRDPGIDDEPYSTTSLIECAHQLERPLLLIHGLADDNVVAAHTLQLSSALLAAGKDHEVLPLSGVTHMTPQEEVAENLLLHQLRFIQRTLPRP